MFIGIGSCFALWWLELIICVCLLCKSFDSMELMRGGWGGWASLSGGGAIPTMAHFFLFSLRSAKRVATGANRPPAAD